MKAAIYARYSTDRQNQTSITAQVNRCSEYCRDNHIDIVNVFIDEAMSGTNTDREGFLRLLSRARAGEFDTVVIYDITRGSRDVADWFGFRKQMALLNISIVSATERLGDITNPNDFLTELITVGIGQHSVLQTRQKSRDGIKERAGQGKFCGGYPPLGYIVVDGDYVIEPVEAAAVRMIFEEYTSGHGYGHIVEKLDSLGVLSKRSRPIGENAIHHILKNERYIGRFSWNKRQVKLMRRWAGGKPNPDAVVIEGIIPRIISDEVWERTRKRMSENKHNKMNKSRVNRQYLLSGILRCGKCGGSYVGITTTNKKGYEYSFYSCATKKRLHTCDAKNIAAADIEPLIVNLVKNDILNGQFIEDTADAILATAAGVTDTRAEYEKEIEKVDRKINNLTKTLADGFDSESVRQAISELEARKKVLKDQFLSAGCSLHIPSREELISSLWDDAQRAISEPGCMRELIQKYIVKIEISDDEILVYAVKDLASASYVGAIMDDEKEQNAGNSPSVLNTIGCGGGI